MCTPHLLLALVLTVITTAASAQSFQETSVAFRKFEAKTKAGVSYNKYVEALPDIEFSTREFELVSGDLNKKNAASFRDALEKYKQAGLAWEQYIKWVVGNGDTLEWQQFFVDKVRPHFCPGARTVVGVDVLMPCLSKNWNEAGELVASLREAKAEPLPAGKRRVK